MTQIEKPTAVTGAAALMSATNREHLGTVLCGLWMTVGLFLDGYFHQNLDRTTESFLTPWHAVFYAGFAASALWIGSMSRRRDGGTFDWRLRFLPPGYHGARRGLVLFAAGAVGDAAWHTAFGVERGIDALLSPTHLLLFAGLVSILTAPYRSGTGPPWIIVGSVVSTTALVGFFLNFAWGLGIATDVRTAYDPITEVGESQVIAGVASMLVTTAILFGAARLLVAGRVPRGALAALFAAVALLVSVAFDEDAEGVAAAIVAGVSLDLFVRTRLHRPHAFLAAAAILWSTYMGALAVDGIEWQAEIWIGAVVLSSLAAYAIAPRPEDLR